MIKLIICLAVAALPAICFAQSQAGKKLQVEIYTGYQQDKFNWSIAGNAAGTNPNIYSELKWQLKSQQIGGALQYNFWKNFVLQGGYDMAYIQSGSVNDSDYSGDNRTGNIYNETFGADKGSFRDLSAHIGYRFKLEKHWLMPFAGYGFNYQTLYLSGVANTLSQDLSSTYKTTWKGLVGGVTASLNLLTKFSIDPTLKYNQLTYNSRANWNLIQAFEHPVSFRQTADGYALQAQLKLNYHIIDCWTVHLTGNYSHWETGNGTDRLYQIDGEQPVTQFNGAKRNTWAASVGTGINF